mmetsp:Transcript_20956/g.57997  ORF Transcript_20956/g.57997 Transcript_20956/m.57997 type:complete len:220 (+) Transcript_20956:1239-1898(+)
MHWEFDGILVDDPDRVLRATGGIKNGIKGRLIPIAGVKFNALLDFVGPLEQFQIKLDIFGFRGVNAHLHAFEFGVEGNGIHHFVTLNQRRLGRCNQFIGREVVRVTLALIDGRVDGQFHFGRVQNLHCINPETLWFDNQIEWILLAIHQIRLDEHGRVVGSVPEVDFRRGGSTIGLEHDVHLFGFGIHLPSVHGTTLDSNRAIDIGLIADAKVQRRCGG